MPDRRRIDSGGAMERELKYLSLRRKNGKKEKKEKYEKKEKRICYTFVKGKSSVQIERQALEFVTVEEF